ncbi:dual oxidase maturation factor 1 [Plakobranchus ocellatus]|uniref:Dual oxidase maturation factor 1 n=1 Tax=Plakobranchus ocellatus TaxID=259542 RepID=A0AAV3ZL21_9GAST|nr:dual oxidase maturation factor 1 [Plakobranchus ocellatus]
MSGVRIKVRAQNQSQGSELMSGVRIKVRGQNQSQGSESMSEVRIKVRGQIRCQGLKQNRVSGSKSWVRTKIRGSESGSEAPNSACPGEKPGPPVCESDALTPRPVRLALCCEEKREHLGLSLYTSFVQNQNRVLVTGLEPATEESLQILGETFTDLPREKMAAWFKEFRNEHGFTSYSDNETPVTVDVALLAVTYFCVLLSVATLIATLGIRGREKWSAALRACYAVAVGSIILVCIVGHDWQRGEVHITSPYVYRSNLPFEGSVGLRVSLHGTNVTLDGYYKGAAGEGYVYYAEEMPWADFGEARESYAHYLHRGLPEPVLKVLEYISIDDGGLRWGRAFQTAGHFCSVLLWTAFAFWLVTNLLLFSVVVYGAYMFFLTGVSMVMACVSYHVCQLKQPLVISFGDVDLRISYGWCFWLALATGCITVILGLTLILFDRCAHDEVAVFFHLERLDEEEYFEPDDKKTQANPSSSLRFTLDRRGTLVPPTGETRRGSIFLEPGRRPSRYNDFLLNTLGMSPLSAKAFSAAGKGLSRSSCSLNKMADQDATKSVSKTNPVYGMTLSPFDITYQQQQEQEDDGETCSEMEYVCKDSKVCSSPRKPSLATLREHRDNHANEKIYASNSNGAAQVQRGHGLSVSSPSLGEKADGQSCNPLGSRDRRDITAENSSPGMSIGDQSFQGSDASSLNGIVLSPTSFPFPSSATPTPDLSTVRRSSCPPATSERQAQSPPPEIVVEMYSRQNSVMSSSSSEGPSAASSEDSGRGASDSKTSAGDNSSSGENSGPEDEGTKFSTVIGFGPANKRDVVVNIETASL